jgi:hypothetical protein
VLSTVAGPANGQGNGDPGPQEPPEWMEAEVAPPEDIRAMDDEALKLAVRAAVIALFQKAEKPRDEAQKRCIQLTGKPREECERIDLEKLLMGLRDDIKAKEATA